GDNYGFTTGSPGLAGVTRAFSSFDAAAQEAGRSRIYGGIHFEFSNQAGLDLGGKVADSVLSAFSVVTDQSPPKVLLDSSSVPGSATHANLTLGGRVTDNLSGVASLTMRLDDGPAAAVAFDTS